MGRFPTILLVMLTPRKLGEELNLNLFLMFLLGCPRKLGSMVRISGLFHLYKWGIPWGEITH